jgi:UDP-galactopyranose mutase
MNTKVFCLTQIGPELYEIFIRGYTKKQWMKDPKELPSDIIKRLPIRLTYNDNYHESKWSGIPSLGYTQWISNMIGDTPVELGVDFFQLNDWKRYGYRLVYTGKVDALFDYCYGDLEYRTLRFENQILNGDFQGVAQVNYTDETIPWTRITEHKHFNHKNQDLTVITREYPEVFSRGTTPYYPINDGKNYEIYKQYKKRLEDYPEVIGGGRLCEFKYMDMDAVIASALKKARSL